MDNANLNPYRDGAIHRRTGQSLNKTFSRNHLWRAVLRWFDTETNQPRAERSQALASKRLDWVRLIPFICLHLGCLGVIITGVSTTAFLACLLLYAIRMFAITGFYHRYFSHRTFKTSRGWQCVFAVLGNAAAQRGPLWWAGHHRHHHLKADQNDDIHSPVTQGFWHSHMGWFASDQAFATPWHRIKDFAIYPELRWLNRFDIVVPTLMALCLYALGELLNTYWPELHTSGLQLLVWGFCISTVLVFHATAAINSLGHLWGKRDYNTPDQSRNNAFLALITFGEGWHNNHHRWPVSARQGFHWWQPDLTYYGLKLLEMLGIIWDLKPVPERICQEGKTTGTRICP